MRTLTQQLSSHNRVAACLLCLGILFGANNALAADPWETANRQLYQFNDFFDTLIIKPVATIYANVTPPILQQGVGNFFSNIDDLSVAINDLLQLKLEAAASDSARVLLNTTIGVVGLIDVATPIGLDKNDEDFGQTFGAWGIPAGPYVIIPTVGPSTVRDAFGWMLGIAFNPFFYGDSEVGVPMYVLENTSARAGVLAFDELVFGDEYIFVREAYLQRREYLISDGEVEDEFGDF
ncbi:MAG: VacJ family lipoprotein [Gammaproteobacteria bacterium]|nr:VacJ family lipoprotein [Pseudomonadales bacterium]MCP5346278.1 VacJ family lipoprotein [Pseudomonadales bacterium]